MLVLPEFFRNKGYVTLGAGKTFQSRGSSLPEGRLAGEQRHVELEDVLARAASWVKPVPRTPVPSRIRSRLHGPASGLDVSSDVIRVEVEAHLNRRCWGGAGRCRGPARHLPPFMPYGTSNIRHPDRGRPGDMPDVAWAAAKGATVANHP